MEYNYDKFSLQTIGIFNRLQRTIFVFEVNIKSYK